MLMWGFALFWQRIVSSDAWKDDEDAFIREMLTYTKVIDPTTGAFRRAHHIPVSLSPPALAPVIPTCGACSTYHTSLALCLAEVFEMLSHMSPSGRQGSSLG